MKKRVEEPGLTGFKRNNFIVNWLRVKLYKDIFTLKRKRSRYLLKAAIILPLGVYFFHTTFRNEPEKVEIGDLYGDAPIAKPVFGLRIVSEEEKPSSVSFLQYTKYKFMHTMNRLHRRAYAFYIFNIKTPMQSAFKAFEEEHKMDLLYELEGWNNFLPSSWRFSDFPELLLPDPLPDEVQPMTLCIELELFYDLVTKNKRAGVEKFFLEAAQFTEVVVFCKLDSFATGKMLAKLKAIDGVSFHVGNMAFRRGYERGTYTPRYLNRLNRDLSKVVCLDYSKEEYPENPENVMILPQEKWRMNPYDTDLLDILPILRGMAKQVQAGQDVRKIIEEYEDVDPARVGRVILGGQVNKPHFRTLDYHQIKLLPDGEE